MFCGSWLGRWSRTHDTLLMGQNKMPTSLLRNILIARAKGFEPLSLLLESIILPLNSALIWYVTKEKRIRVIQLAPRGGSSICKPCRDRIRTYGMTEPKSVALPLGYATIAAILNLSILERTSPIAATPAEKLASRITLQFSAHLELSYILY